MSVNSSSNASLRSHRCSSNSLIYPNIFHCAESNVSSSIFISFTFTNLLLLLPLYILILWMGFRRWRRRGSVTVGTTSHSDVITYHMVTLEVMGVLGTVFYCVAIFTCSLEMMSVGYFLFIITYPGQTFFHCLTCMERYLAVAHPITYLSLRKAGGVKVRNIGVGCVWLLCVGVTGLTVLYFPYFPIVLISVTLSLSLIVVSFCSISALRVLIRLGLGKVGGDRVDQSKQRAFHTIMAIMGTLMLRFCGLLISNFMFNLQTGIGRSGCVGVMFSFWLCLPSSLILPLLFLHRAGKLACSR